jgi:trk system potassium uptake protein TrkA
MVIREMVVDKLAGKTLRAIDLTNRYNVQIIAIKKQNARKYQFIPRADDVLSRGDRVIIIGKEPTLSKIVL